MAGPPKGRAGTTATGGDRWYRIDRLGGLRRFAFAITAFNVLGHLWFGFEQSIAQPLISLAAAYVMEIVLELVSALAQRRRPRFIGRGLQETVDFFLPAQISGMACAMLLYANDQLAPVAFAAAAAIVSKHLLRVTIADRSRHVFNPSNLGITLTLLLFPWVGISPPYHFTENLSGAGDWILPGLIVVSGTLLNTRFTRRLPLIATWLLAFVAQAYVRHMLFGSSFAAGLMPMTGVAFILFTFYMLTDPPTTPGSVRGQMAFGIGVAATYGLLMVSHVVFGLFFALSIVCGLRALWLTWSSYRSQRLTRGDGRVVADPVAARAVEVAG